MFLANEIISGVLILVGIMLCSRISAFAAFIGSAVGAGVAALVGCDRDAIEQGMYGFNPSLTLCSILMFYVPSIGSVSVGIVASIVTVFIQLALATSMSPLGLPYMTLPFCIAALAFIIIQGTTSNVISVPLSSMTTPEDHLKRVSKLSNGFELLYGAIRSSSYKGSIRKRSWIASYKDGTHKMSSALSEYDEAIHGEDQEGLVSRLLKYFRKSSIDEPTAGRRLSQLLSFRMSFALRSTSFSSAEKDSYAHIFKHIDVLNKHQIAKSQFTEFLVSVGLCDEVSIDFASEAFQLMDLDGSGDIGEWTLALCNPFEYSSSNP